MISDAPDYKMPATTEDAKRRAAAVRAARRGGDGYYVGPFDGPEDLTLYVRCITRGVPGSMMPAIYGNSYEIVQGPGVVAIRYEMVHDTRVIPLDGRKTLPAGMQSYMGDSRGHWEGDTLVVEGSRYLEQSAFGGASSALKTIERFRPTSRDTIEWSITFEDAATWVRPWTFGMRLTRDDEQPIFEYACHEGNEGLRGILSAARVGREGAGGASVQVIGVTAAPAAAEAVGPETGWRRRGIGTLRCGLRVREPRRRGVRGRTPRARTAPRRAAPRHAARAAGSSAPARHAASVSSSAWPTSCATTRPSRRPCAMSSVIASPESASPRWRRHHEARARHRHEDALRAPGEQGDPERVLVLRVVLAQFAIVEDDRQRSRRRRARRRCRVQSTSTPSRLQMSAELLRHGVPGHAAHVVPHHRLEPDPDRPGDRRSGRRRTGLPRAGGSAAASRRRAVTRCRHKTVFRLT